MFSLFLLLFFPCGSNALTVPHLIFVTFLYHHAKTLLPWSCLIRPPSFVFSCTFLQVLEGWISLKRLINSREQIDFLEHTKTLSSPLRFNCKPECALACQLKVKKATVGPNLNIFMQSTAWEEWKRCGSTYSSGGPSHWIPAVDS